MVERLDEEEPAYMGALLGPPRNSARDIPSMFFPNLSQPETYGVQPPPGMDASPQGKLPTSDPRMMGALADVGNVLPNAIPFGGPLKAAAALGVGAKGALAALRKAEGPTGIRAYHSSPHDFETFDLSKIGTGEGAQVYGHGLYFAENPAVSGQGGEYWQQFLRRFGGDERRAAEYLRDVGFDRNRAMRLLDENDPGVAGLIKSGKPVGPRTYEVDIKARPEEMLDFDRMLSKQGALGARALNIMAPFGNDPKMLYRNPKVTEKLAEADIPGLRYLDQGSRVNDTQARLRSARDSVATWKSFLENATAGNRAYRQSQLDRAEESLQQAVTAAAVPVKQTSNYVIFDPARIAILKKYGMAGAVPAMGALAAQDRYAQ